MNKSKLTHIMRCSHLDDIDKADISMSFAQNVAKIRIERRYTQEDMAYMLGIGKQTYVRIESGTNATVNAEIALKIAQIFRVPVMSLFGFSNSNVDAYKDYMRCTDRTQRLIRSIMTADIQMQEMLSEYDEADTITVISFAEEVRDGINISRFLHRSENISEYKRFKWYQEAQCIIEINSLAYYPMYLPHDRLIVSARSPSNGDIGVFIRGSQFYIRTVRNAQNSVYLLPIDRHDSFMFPDMIIDRRKKEEFNDYTVLGTIIAVI